MASLDVHLGANEVLAAGAKQCASLFGVDQRTWRTWSAAGEIPAPVRIGGSVRWSVAELREWMAAGCPRRTRWDEIRAASNKKRTTGGAA